MVIFLEFLCKNSIVKKLGHNMIVSYPNLCYNEVYYKGSVYFDFILYVPVNIFSVMLGWVFLS